MVAARQACRAQGPRSAWPRPAGAPAAEAAAAFPTLSPTPRARCGYGRRGWLASTQARRARVRDADAARRVFFARGAADRGQALRAGPRSRLGAGRGPDHPLPFRLRGARLHPAVLDDLPATPATHFRLYFYAAVIELIREAAARAGSMDTLLERHGFVATYLNELAESGLEGGTLEEAGGWWREAVGSWEQSVEDRLPLRELRRSASLDYESMVLLMGAGLSEEDARLGVLLDTAAASGRASAGLFAGWFRDLEASEVRTRIRRLAQIGLLQVANLDGPFPAWTLSCPALLWEAMREEAAEAKRFDLAWAELCLAAQCPALASLSFADETRAHIERAGRLLEAGELEGIVVRGPHHNGRRATLAALARQAGRNLLEIRAHDRDHPPDWKLAGPLAVLWDAMPAFVFEPGPGEVVTLPKLSCECGPVGVVLGYRGGLTGTEGRKLVAIDLPMPDAGTRRTLWRQALGGSGEEHLAALSENFRMTSGNIRHVSALAHSHARVNGRSSAGVADVQAAARGLDRSALDLLASRVDLSTVVNKYIGETEKNLDRALSCAEELDVMLLFDEGDALLGQRTSVNSSNDRYANLETNFLLQRIEAYQGILLITTNLADQIDSAFQRRIDAVVDFRLPQAQERLAIFAMHLPPGHEVGAALLDDIAYRCALSGGQIRNAVLHASLVAFEERRALEDRHLEAAVQREYRKAGAVCPLRGPKRMAAAGV